MRISTILLAASLAALMAATAAAQGTGQGQAASASATGAPNDATYWSKQSPEALAAERERRHRATQAAIEAAREPATLLAAAACDGPGPDYQKAFDTYQAAWQRAKRAAGEEVDLSPSVIKATRAWEASFHAWWTLKNQTPPPNDAILDRALTDTGEKAKAHNEAREPAIDAIMQQAAADGAPPPHGSQCFKPVSKPKVAESPPANAGPPPAAPEGPPPKYVDTKVDQPILPKAEVFTPPPQGGGSGSGAGSDTHGSLYWSGQGSSLVARELARRHTATVAAYAGAGGALSTLNGVGCAGPADSLDAALSDYDAAYSHAQQAVAHEAALDRTVLASARAGAGTDAAFDAAVLRIAAAHKPLPNPGGICPSSRIAETLPPPPPPINGQTGPAIVDGMRHTDREPTTRVELPSPPQPHGGCAGGGGYMPPPPPPPEPPPPPP